MWAWLDCRINVANEWHRSGVCLAGAIHLRIFRGGGRDGSFDVCDYGAMRIWMMTRTKVAYEPLDRYRSYDGTLTSVITRDQIIKAAMSRRPVEMTRRRPGSGFCIMIGRVSSSGLDARTTRVDVLDAADPCCF